MVVVVAKAESLRDRNVDGCHCTFVFSFSTRKTDRSLFQYESRTDCGYQRQGPEWNYHNKGATPAREDGIWTTASARIREANELSYQTQKIAYRSLTRRLLFNFLTNPFEVKRTNYFFLLGLFNADWPTELYRESCYKIYRYFCSFSSVTRLIEASCNVSSSLQMFQSHYNQKFLKYCNIQHTLLYVLTDAVNATFEQFIFDYQGYKGVC